METLNIRSVRDADVCPLLLMLLKCHIKLLLRLFDEANCLEFPQVLNMWK